MTDEQHTGEAELDPRLRALAQRYHEPPATPREAIWAGIQARRPEGGFGRRGGSAGSGRVLPFRWSPPKRALLWITGVAAVLALGIGLGRLSYRPAAPLPPGGAEAAPSVALRVATTQHLSRVEALLTGLRTGDGMDPTFSAQARDLLTATRLMLDSRAGDDARTRALLEDLELILVQIVQYRPAQGRDELDLITDGLEQRQVMPRLRTAIPSGPPRIAGAS